MTAPLIAPVIPSRTRPADRSGRPGAGRGLPLASPLASPPPPADAVYGIGRIDASGRVGDHVVTCALGWRKGDRLTVTADAGVVVVRRDPGGMVTVSARACIAIPAALRRRCGLRAGDRVLLAALPGQDALAAYPLAVRSRPSELSARHRAEREASREPRRAARVPARRRLLTRHCCC